jgi:hypothetical protein
MAHGRPSAVPLSPAQFILKPSAKRDLEVQKNLRNGYIVVKRAVISRLPVIAGRSSSSPDAASRLQLNVRIVKSLAVVVGAPIALLLAGVAIFLITDFVTGFVGAVWLGVKVMLGK